MKEPLLVTKQVVSRQSWSGDPLPTMSAAHSGLQEDSHHWDGNVQQGANLLVITKLCFEGILVKSWERSSFTSLGLHQLT